MRPSNYIKAFTYSDNEHLLIFSTRNCSKTIIKKNAWEVLEHSAITPENESILKKVGLLVDDREEEKRSLSRARAELDYNYTVVDIIVVLNLDCNFACKYCYEGDMKGRIYMSEETAADLIDFIRQRFDYKKRLSTLISMVESPC